MKSHFMEVLNHFCVLIDNKRWMLASRCFPSGGYESKGQPIHRVPVSWNDHALGTSEVFPSVLVCLRGCGSRMGFRKWRCIIRLDTPRGGKLAKSPQRGLNGVSEISSRGRKPAISRG